MSVVVSVQELGACRQQVKIEIPAAAVEQERHRVLKEYGRMAKVPGFRRGKVPANVLRQRFGKEMDQEVIEHLLPRFWRQAKEESQLAPLLPPEVEEVSELVAGQPLTFTATVETRPALELGDLDGFDLPEPEIEPTEEELREAIDDLRRQVAPWILVDRPAARGDRVKTEIIEIPDPAAAGEGEAAAPEPQSVDIEVGDPKVWEELSLAVTGLAAGQEARFSHRDRPDANPSQTQPELAGASPPERHFRVEVVAVEERELPELDNEFARSMGDFDDVEALTERMREHLRERKTDKRRSQRRDALLDQLRQRYPIELPSRVVDEQVREMINEQAGRLASQGVNLERAGIDWQRIGEEIRPVAERAVHNRLLLEAAAEKRSIQVEPQEFESALAALAHTRGTSVSSLRHKLDEEDQENLRGQLLRNKVIRHLLGEEEQAESEAAEATAAP